MQKFLTFIRSSKWYIIGLIILAVVTVKYVTKQPVSPFETTTVVKGSIVQEVSVTGRVESDTEVDLSFEKSGRVVSVPTQVGQKVKKGDVLVRLDTSELGALRAQAVANLDYEIARLSELNKGSRTEDIAISQSQLDSANQALFDAGRSLLDKLEVAYTTSDDAVRNKTDVLLQNPRTSNPVVNFPITDNKLEVELPQIRVAVESVLNNWAIANATLSDKSDLVQRAVEVEKWLDQMKSYLDRLAYGVNGVNPSSQINQTTIDGWKSQMSTARTNVNSAITSLIAADQAYRSAKSAVLIAQNELALKKAGATPESIAAQEAKIAGMRATIQNYDAQIGKNMLTAPFSGVVIKQDAKQGQSISPGVVLVSMISDGKYKITANVPEVDIAKIKVGNKAEISLDAYGSDVKFAADVALIDPAETILQGVPTYKVTLYFSISDERVKSGMTANIVIKTASREGALMVPSRAVYSRETDPVERFVKVPDQAGMTAKEVTVTTGLRGSNGMIEILSGLQEGDKVITFDSNTK